MNSVKLGIVAIVAGIVMTVITGWIAGILLYTVAGGLRYFMEPLLGASNYGLPTAASAMRTLDIVMRFRF